MGKVWEGDQSAWDDSANFKDSDNPEKFGILEAIDPFGISSGVMEGAWIDFTFTPGADSVNNWTDCQGVEYCTEWASIKCNQATHFLKLRTPFGARNGQAGGKDQHYTATLLDIVPCLNIPLTPWNKCYSLLNPVTLSQTLSNFAATKVWTVIPGPCLYVPFGKWKGALLPEMPGSFMLNVIPPGIRTLFDGGLFSTWEFSALKKDCTLTCLWGGEFSIVECGQHAKPIPYNAITGLIGPDLFSCLHNVIGILSNNLGMVGSVICAACDSIITGIEAGPEAGFKSLAVQAVGMVLGAKAMKGLSKSKGFQKLAAKAMSRIEAGAQKSFKSHLGWLANANKYTSVDAPIKALTNKISPVDLDSVAANQIKKLIAIASKNSDGGETTTSHNGADGGDASGGKKTSEEGNASKPQDNNGTEASENAAASEPQKVNATIQQAVEHVGKTEKPTAGGVKETIIAIVSGVEIKIWIKDKESQHNNLVAQVEEVKSNAKEENKKIQGKIDANDEEVRQNQYETAKKLKDSIEERDQYIKAKEKERDYLKKDMEDKKKDYDANFDPEKRRELEDGIKRKDREIDSFQREIDRKKSDMDTEQRYMESEKKEIESYEEKLAKEESPILKNYYESMLEYKKQSYDGHQKKYETAKTEYEEVKRVNEGKIETAKIEQGKYQRQQEHMDYYKQRFDDAEKKYNDCNKEMNSSSGDYSNAKKNLNEEEQLLNQIKQDYRGNPYEITPQKRESTTTGNLSYGEKTIISNYEKKENSAPVVSRFDYMIMNRRSGDIDEKNDVSTLRKKRNELDAASNLDLSKLTDEQFAEILLEDPAGNFKDAASNALPYFGAGFVAQADPTPIIDAHCNAADAQDTSGANPDNDVSGTAGIAPDDENQKDNPAINGSVGDIINNNAQAVKQGPQPTSTAGGGESADNTNTQNGTNETTNNGQTGNKGTTPDTKSAQTGNKGTTPDTKSAQTGNKGTTPNANSSQTGNKGTTPNANGSQTGNKGTTQNTNNAPADNKAGTNKPIATNVENDKDPFAGYEALV